MVIAFSGGLWLGVAVLLAAMLSRAQWQLRQARSACAALERDWAEARAVLDTVPIASFRWPAGQGCGESRGGDDQAAGYAEFLAGLAPSNATQLEEARLALQRSGTPFAATVAAGAGAAYAIEGRQTATGATVLWLVDATAAVTAQRLHGEATSLREMIDAIPVPVWRRGRDLAPVDCNQAYAGALEVSRELALGEGRELAPGDSRKRAIALADSAPDLARHGERAHVVIGGSRRLIEITEIPSPTGGTIGFALDRTDVETAEAELRRHISAHAAVLESIGTAVAIYGADKRLKFFNAAFAVLWGIEEAWLATEPSFGEILERLHERRRIPEYANFPAFKRERLQLFTSLIEPQQELMHLPDNRTLMLSISPHPFGGLIFIYEDVTDRLALERSCNTLTRVRRATLDHLFEGIAVYGSNGRLKLHNPAYLNLWGLSQDDVAGEPHISEIIEKNRTLIDDGSDWTAIKPGLIAKIMAHTLTSGPLYRQDGSMLQMATVPLPDGDVLVTFLDVTDGTRVERALRERNEALETAGRLKSEFIANMSYELRTPLNAVIGFSEILTNQYFGTLNPQQLEYCRGILISSQQLTGLINDILDLAAIEAGYLVLETGRVEVCEMLQTVMTLTRERARHRDLRLDLCCPPGIGAIEADERRLKQALFNLISNAIKFTPPQGTIRIEAERTERELLLIVADTGVGIPQADQARVFEKFEHGPRQSGAGLGLSLVKRLIELHGGSIAIESARDRGTKIICRLPVAGREIVFAEVCSRQSLGRSEDVSGCEETPTEFFGRCDSDKRRMAEILVAA